jgi:hypothetical protein
VTEDHLVFTPHGQVAASVLKKGDVLFRSLDQREPCHVLSVEREAHIEDYFAINCARSTVLADGVLASTFGKHHVIPSLWMSWLSPVLGVKTASVWGDKIASWLNNMNLL